MIIEIGPLFYDDEDTDDQGELCWDEIGKKIVDCATAFENAPSCIGWMGSFVVTAIELKMMFVLQ